MLLWGHAVFELLTPKLANVHPNLYAVSDMLFITISCMLLTAFAKCQYLSINSVL